MDGADEAEGEVASAEGSVALARRESSVVRTSSSFWGSTTRLLRQLSSTCFRDQRGQKRVGSGAVNAHLDGAHEVRHALLSGRDDAVDEGREVAREVVDIRRGALDLVPRPASVWFGEETCLAQGVEQVENVDAVVQRALSHTINILLLGWGQGDAPSGTPR